MDLLPDDTDRAWLIHELAYLVDTVGPDRLVATPLVLGNDQAFPDRWTPDAVGVYRVLRRLMTYAGLSDLDVTLELGEYSDVHVEPTAGGGTRKTRHGTAAWFAGIDGFVARFGVDVGQLAEPEGMVGVLAHEVAHAYRDHHGLQVPDRDLEERLTDLTTVYLGFGVLTANASLQFDSGGINVNVNWWKTNRRGYLPYQAMCFLLGACAVARGEDLRALGRHLATTQKASFAAACKELDRDRLIERLGLGEPATWPPRRALPPVIIDDDELPEVAPPAAVAAVVAAPADGRPTFRVAQRPLSMLGAGIGTNAAIAVFLFARDAMPAVAVPLLMAALLLAGLWLGPRRRFDRCASSECEIELPPEPSACPGCHRPIVGRIDHVNQRLEAEERWERDQDGYSSSTSL